MSTYIEFHIIENFMNLKEYFEEYKKIVKTSVITCESKSLPILSNGLLLHLIKLKVHTNRTMTGNNFQYSFFS